MNNEHKLKRKKSFKREVGLKIWQQIQDSGYSREYVAERMGVTLRTINYWQSGVKLPSLENLFLLADFLEISVGSLLDF